MILADMKTLTFLLLMFGLQTLAFGQSDSLAYQLQRKKINGMLDARSSKFGEFTESLQSRTGIFGLKTKRDMQKSIDILKQIILTDNQILKETKTLLDYKTFEQQQAITQTVETGNRNLAYMRTINKLQNELEQQRKLLEETKDESRFYQVSSILLLIICLIGGLFTFGKILKKRRVKA